VIVAPATTTHCCPCPPRDVVKAAPPPPLTQVTTDMASIALMAVTHGAFIKRGSLMSLWIMKFLGNHRTCGLSTVESLAPEIQVQTSVGNDGIVTFILPTAMRYTDDQLVRNIASSRRQVGK
jgi:hypothetical protein